MCFVSAATNHIGDAKAGQPASFKTQRELEFLPFWCYVYISTMLKEVFLPHNIWSVSMVVLRDATITTTTPTSTGIEREELYRQFYVHRRKMGDPTSMRSPEEVFGTKASGMVSFFLIFFQGRVTKGLSTRLLMMVRTDFGSEGLLCARAARLVDGPLTGGPLLSGFPNMFFACSVSAVPPSR